MRFVLLVIGFVLGVGSALAYAWFAGASPEDTAAPTPARPDPPMSVALGEPFLTALLRTGRSPLGDVTVKAGDGVLVVNGTVDVLGRPTAASATLRPVVRAGELHVDVVQTELADLPVPMEQALEQQMNQRIRSLLVDLPVTITGVSVVPHRGVIVTCEVDVSALRPATVGAATPATP